MSFKKLALRLLSTKVWRTRVYACDGGVPRPKLAELLFEIGMPQFRWRRMHLHTVADPFLLVANDKLWLFVEEQRHESKGCSLFARAAGTADAVDVGVVGLWDVVVDDMCDVWNV